MKSRALFLAVLMWMPALLPAANNETISTDEYFLNPTPTEKTERNVRLAVEGKGGGRKKRFLKRDMRMEDEVHISCYESVARPLQFLKREDWDLSKGPVRMEAKPKYIVVRDGGKGCSTEKECADVLRLMMSAKMEKPCDVRENFYIGGDGNVYEGRGWDVEPYWNLRGLRSKALTVQFLGSHYDEHQFRKQIRAFRSLLSASLLTEKLTEGFKIISMRQLLNHTKFMDEKLSAIVGSWEKFIDDEQTSALWEYSIPGHLKMINRDEWQASLLTKELGTLLSKNYRVMISESGDECFGQENCKLWMRKNQKSLIGYYGDLFHNFYIAENGDVFEGRGWKFKAHWNLPSINNSYLSVQLLGNFTSKTPTKEAINSLKQLVQLGIELGKVSPAHVLTSIRQLYQENGSLGISLRKYAEGWFNWRDGSANVLASVGFDRRDILYKIWGLPWDDFNVTVMVDDGGDRCFTYEECSVLIGNQPLRSYNYYIGEDGHIYKGSGNKVSEWKSIFDSNSVVTIKFLGSFEENVPLPLALRAFKSLMDNMIGSRRSPKSYIKLFSLRETYKTSSQALRGLDHYLSYLNTLTSDFTTVAWGNSTPWVERFPIKSFQEWNPDKYIRNPYVETVSSTPLQKPIEYVLVGDLDLECYPSFCKLDKKLGLRMDIIQDNFYIRDDGWAYEGLGWDTLQKWKAKILKNNFLAVKFVGEFQYSLPTPMAIYGFRRLMKIGVDSGKLSRDYKIISTRQVFDDPLSLGDKLWENIQTLDHWSRDPLPLFSEEAVPPKLPLYVRKKQLSSTGAEEIRELSMYENKISCILVMNAGNQCFNADECAVAVRDAENTTFSSFGFEPASFYVGDDGRIYEGRGWSTLFYVHHLPPCYVVSFLGKFDVNAPTEKAISAFQDLITLGRYHEILNQYYKFISIRDICEYSEWIGQSLHKSMLEWEHSRGSRDGVCITPPDSKITPGYDSRWYI